MYETVLFLAFLQLLLRVVPGRIHSMYPCFYASMSMYLFVSIFPSHTYHHTLNLLRQYSSWEMRPLTVTLETERFIHDCIHIHPHTRGCVSPREGRRCEKHRDKTSGDAAAHWQHLSSRRGLPIARNVSRRVVRCFATSKHLPTPRRQPAAANTREDA